MEKQFPIFPNSVQRAQGQTPIEVVGHLLLNDLSTLQRVADEAGEFLIYLDRVLGAVSRHDAVRCVMGSSYTD